MSFQSNSDIVAAGKAAYDTHGAGLSSVRFVCGTQVCRIRGRIRTVLDILLNDLV